MPSLIQQLISFFQAGYFFNFSDIIHNLSPSLLDFRSVMLVLCITRFYVPPATLHQASGNSFNFYPHPNVTKKVLCIMAMFITMPLYPLSCSGENQGIYLPGIRLSWYSVAPTPPEMLPVPGYPFWFLPASQGHRCGRCLLGPAGCPRRHLCQPELERDRWSRREIRRSPPRSPAVMVCLNPPPLPLTYLRQGLDRV